MIIVITTFNKFDNYTFVQIIVILSLQLVQFADNKKQMIVII